jgi:hypothetical protein
MFVELVPRFVCSAEHYTVNETTLPADWQVSLSNVKIITPRIHPHKSGAASACRV